MANKYLRSTDGNDADDGSTWALANATMAGLTADMAAGDDAYISQAHAETDAAGTNVTITFPGTVASPNRLIGASDAAEPPTTTDNGWSLTRTSTGGTTSLSFAGCFRAVGGNINSAGASATGIAFGINNGDVQVLDGVAINITNTASATPKMNYGTLSTGQRSKIIHNNCPIKFGHVSQGFAIRRGIVEWNGGELATGTAAITTLFSTASSAAAGVIQAGLKNFDLSRAGSTLNICASAFDCYGELILERCKMPASWSGGLFAGDPSNPFFRVSMYNCDSGDTNYKILVGDRQGTLRDETTLVMTGGESESWKVTTTANANETLNPFYTDFMSTRNTSVGSAKTITVEILHDSTTDLTDGDIWLEVECLGTSGFPLGSITSGKRGVLTTAADHTNSSVTWTTTGMTNPNKQYLTVSVTPQEAGNIIARIGVAKASYTVYINPAFTIT